MCAQTVNKNTLRFPNTFPKQLKPIAEESYREFARHLPTKIQFFIDFICSPSMEGFWVDVAKILPVSPPKGKSSYTVHSVFSCFFTAFYSIENLPDAKKGFDADIKGFQKQLKKLSGTMSNSSKQVRRQINGSLQCTLLDLDNERFCGPILDFKTIIDGLNKNITLSKDTGLLHRQYTRLPRQFKSIKKSGARSHFIKHFSKIINIVYGKNSPAMSHPL